jgi:hypothetical protein
MRRDDAATQSAQAAYLETMRERVRRHPNAAHGTPCTTRMR